MERPTPPFGCTSVSVVVTELNGTRPCQGSLFQSDHDASIQGADGALKRLSDATDRANAALDDLLAVGKQRGGLLGPMELHKGISERTLQVGMVWGSIAISVP